MAGGFSIHRFDGPPPPSPNDPCLSDDVYLKGLVPDSPNIPFEPDAVIRAVFERHVVPRIYWDERGNGFARRGKFQMSILMPSPPDHAIRLGLDGYETCETYLRAIEAERSDWHVTWYGGRWLRDTSAPEI